jgi:hypothetical protein
MVNNQLPRHESTWHRSSSTDDHTGGVSGRYSATVEALQSFRTRSILWQSAAKQISERILEASPRSHSVANNEEEERVFLTESQPYPGPTPGFYFPWLSWCLLRQTSARTEEHVLPKEQYLRIKSSNSRLSYQVFDVSVCTLPVPQSTKTWSPQNRKTRPLLPVLKA